MSLCKEPSLPQGTPIEIKVATEILWDGDDVPECVPPKTVITVVASEAAWWRVIAKDGRRGRIRRNQLPPLAEKILEYHFPGRGPIVRDDAFQVLQRTATLHPQLRKPIEKLLGAARRAGDALTLLRSAAGGWLQGKPSAERQFRGLLSLLLQTRSMGWPAPASPNQNAAQMKVWQQLPRIQLPCLIEPRLLEPLYRGIVRLAHGDFGPGEASQQFMQHAFGALETELALFDRLAMLTAVLDQGAFNDIRQIQAVMSWGAPQPGGFSIPPRFAVPGPLINWCMVERGNQVERATRCLCHERYRIDSIASQTLDLSGRVREGSACRGDTITIRGVGFGDSRTHAAGLSRVFFDRHGREDIEAAGYGSWSDTEVEVVVPSEAITGIVGMEIPCNVDSDCGVITKAPMPSAARTLTIDSPPRIVTFGDIRRRGAVTDVWGLICASIPLAIDVENAEEVFLTDSRGVRHDPPAGILGDRRNIDTTHSLAARDTLEYVLTARNACGTDTASMTLHRFANGWINIAPRQPVIQRGDTRTLPVTLSCRPEHLEIPELELAFWSEDPDLVEVITPSVRFGPTETTGSIDIRVSSERCGITVLRASPVGYEDHPIIGGDDARGYCEPYIVDVPMNLRVTGDLSACEFSELTVRARCAVAPIDKQRVTLDGPGSTHHDFRPVASTIEGGDTAVMTLGVPVLTAGVWQLRVGVEADTGWLTSDPLSLRARTASPEIVSFDFSPIEIRYPGRANRVSFDFDVRHTRRATLQMRDTDGATWRDAATWANPFGERDRCGGNMWPRRGENQSVSRRQQVRLQAESFSDEVESSTPRWIEVAAPRCIRIHARIISEPLASVDDQIAAMNEVFNEWNMRAVLASRTMISAPEYVSVDPGLCNFDASSEALRLFTDHRGGAPGDEIAAFFVRDLGSLYGCAAYRPALPSLLVARNAPRHTLGHEVGHVLGLLHVSDSRRLMNSRATWTELPPDLVESEANTCWTNPIVKIC